MKLMRIGEDRGQSKKFARNVGVRVKILTNFLL